MGTLTIRKNITATIDTSSVCDRCGQEYDFADIELDDVEIVDLEMVRTTGGAAVDVLKCALVCVCGARVVGRKFKYLAKDW
jgi:hypothetical protein